MNAPALTKPAMMPIHRLQVASNLHQFIDDKVLPGTGVTAADFWKGFDAIVCDLAPKNIALLAERDRLQTELDAWHKAHPGPVTDMETYQAFLSSIGYLVPAPKSASTMPQVGPITMWLNSMTRMPAKGNRGGVFSGVMGGMACGLMTAAYQAEERIE